MIDTFYWRLPRPSSEGGFTLIELLVSTALAIVVLGGVLAALESSQRVQARDAEWAFTLQDGRAGLARMAREIRQASKLEETKKNVIVFEATLGSKSWKIKYECSVVQTASLDECVRFAAEKPNSLPGTGTTIVRDVMNGTTVFSYSNESEPTKSYVVTMKLELPSAGTLKQAGSSGYSHHVVLENAAYMRNLYLEG